MNVIHIERLDQPYRNSKVTMCGKWVRNNEVAKFIDDANCPKCIQKMKEYELNEV